MPLESASFIPREVSFGEVIRGETYEEVVTILNETTGEPFPLTGWTVSLVLNTIPAPAFEVLGDQVKLSYPEATTKFLPKGSYRIQIHAVRGAESGIFAVGPLIIRDA